MRKSYKSIFNKITIFLAVILILSFVACSALYLKNRENATTNKSILSYTQFDNSIKNSRLTIFQTVKEQEKELFEILKHNENKEENVKNFHTFLNNIKYYKKAFYEIEYTEENEISTWNPKMNVTSSAEIEGIKYLPIKEKDEIGKEWVRKVKILEPSVPFYRMSYGGEGYFYLDTNYKYLYDTYSKYLTSDWQEYLSIKSIEQTTLGNNEYLNEGFVVAKQSDIKKWLLYWEEFTIKYPNFILNNEINKQITFYTGDFICEEEIFYLDGQDWFTNNWRDEIKSYLKVANPKAKSYKTIKEASTIMNSSKEDYEHFCEKIPVSYSH